MNLTDWAHAQCIHVRTAHRWYRECHRRLVVLDQSEVSGGNLVRAMTGVLTWFRARRHGRRPARDRAPEAVGCAQRDIGPRAVPAAGSTRCGGAG